MLKLKPYIFMRNGVWRVKIFNTSGLRKDKRMRDAETWVWEANYALECKKYNADSARGLEFAKGLMNERE